ncbi:MAG: DUF1329 domain-containing protein [Abyssibacter sp.]|uniref:DUF1329 domain-containing protein n=1 Tax=Abyssibacter sp. TaxID=2320200 RepID=UPI00321B2A4A
MSRSIARLTGMSLAAVAAVASLNAHAKVSADEAAKLGGELTPLGAEKAGNSAGTIPAWDGGYHDPDWPEGKRFENPWPDDKPKFEITKSNMSQYAANLSEGQKAMLQKYDTYKIPVYETRRSAANPQYIYDATKENATRAELTNDGETLVNAAIGAPFPIPKSGKEIIWNHRTRYRGPSLVRYNVQAAVQTSGAFSLFKLKEDVRFNYTEKGMTPDGLNNVLLYFLQSIEEPPRQAGQILLVHETADQVKEPRRAWLYNPGQRRLRRAPNVAYDNPGTGSDGLRTNDQLDTFNGATDRYTWKLVGKKEMYIPYNAYELHSDDNEYDDIIKPGHIDQDLTRYELHRVWVVDATVKDGTSHIYDRRTFYVDEDTWQIALVDIYDKRGQLWRVQEAHAMNFYRYPATAQIAGTVYDLLANRYLVQEMNNEEDEHIAEDFDEGYFAPGNVKKLARK